MIYQGHIQRNMFENYLRNSEISNYQEKKKNGKIRHGQIHQSSLYCCFLQETLEVIKLDS